MAPREKRTVEENAKVAADAFAQIVRFSLNEPFRKKCFDTLQVEGSFDLQNEINEKLLKSLQPAVYNATQSSGYSSQISQPSSAVRTSLSTTTAPSQLSQASSIVRHIENSQLTVANLSQKDEKNVKHRTEMNCSLMQSLQSASFSGDSKAFGSQYSDAATASQSLQVSITQNTQLIQHSAMSQEDKDLEEALAWGEESE